ncbi:30S ribosomal protein S17e [Candidatus Bathyarchaeota archaeon]|nr:30S ribosomal protein S17e [Candidatus Bathyarchaeota archaeon]
MGKIRTAMIKGLAKEFVSKYPDKFTASFKENKQLLKELGVFPSKRIRNQAAGYIVRIIKRIRKNNI